MTQIVPTLADLPRRYGALFCDLWGCLHNGVAPFPAAVAALQGFRAQGGIVMLLTNAPRPKSSVVKQLERLGVPTDCWDDIATSGDAAQAAMFAGAVGQRIFHIGPEKDNAFFTDVADDLGVAPDALTRITRVPLDQAQGIVCTGPFFDLTETPEDYRARFLMAKTMGLKMLCANPDIVVDMGETRIYCAGALAALYEDMGGTSLYYGKPHPPVYDLARNRLARLDPRLTDADILCVGDGIGTDVQGAVAEGLDSLFITGGLAAAEFGPDTNHPDPVLLADWLARDGRQPTWAMGHLR